MAKKTNAPESAAAKTKPTKDKPVKKKALKPAKKQAKKLASGTAAESAKVLSSEVVYEGKLFRITQDRLIEPNGKESVRDVVRHNGSVVILALDSSKSKKDPWIVMERQYRHAASRFLWELPAGKLDPGPSLSPPSLQRPSGCMLRISAGIIS